MKRWIIPAMVSAAMLFCAAGCQSTQCCSTTGTCCKDGAHAAKACCAKCNADCKGMCCAACPMKK